MTLRTSVPIFGQMNLRTIEHSDQWPVGLFTCRTNGTIFGPMTLRTTDLSDYWPYGPMQRPFGISSRPPPPPTPPPTPPTPPPHPTHHPTPPHPPPHPTPPHPHPTPPPPPQGRMTHMDVSKLTIIGSDNGLSPGQRQAIIWTSAGILLIGPLVTNFNEILIGIQTFQFFFKKMHLNMSSGKSAAISCRPQCVNTRRPVETHIRLSYASMN